MRYKMKTEDHPEITGEGGDVPQPEWTFEIPLGHVETEGLAGLGTGAGDTLELRLGYIGLANMKAAISQCAIPVGTSAIEERLESLIGTMLSLPTAYGLPVDHVLSALVYVTCRAFANNLAPGLPENWVQQMAARMAATVTGTLHDITAEAAAEAKQDANIGTLQGAIDAAVDAAPGPTFDV